MKIYSPCDPSHNINNSLDLNFLSSQSYELDNQLYVRCSL